MGKSEEARKRLKDLEDNPKHTKPTKDAEDQTRNDDLDDPKNHKKDGGDQDAKWRKDKDGQWDHPDFE